MKIYSARNDTPEKPDIKKIKYGYTPFEDDSVYILFKFIIDDYLYFYPDYLNEFSYSYNGRRFYSSAQMVDIIRSLPDDWDGDSFVYSNDRTLISDLVNDEEIVLPDDTAVIGQYVFYGNDKIKTVKIPTGTSIIRKRAFQNSSLESIDPGGVEVIEQEAFSGCRNL